MTPSDNAEAAIVCVIGINLARNVSALHGVNRAGQPVLLPPKARRGQLLDILAQLPPYLIGMEAACSRAHRRARQLAKFGHKPKLMAPNVPRPTTSPFGKVMRPF